MGATILKMTRLTVSSLSWEKFYPFVVGLLVGAPPLVWDWCIGSDQQLLLSATITFGAITSGFVGTSLAILTSLDTGVMQRIRRTRYVRVLRGYMGWGLFSGIFVCCVSMAGLLWQLTEQVWFTAVWCAAIVFCLACLYRLSKLMLQIFSDHENQP